MKNAGQLLGWLRSNGVEIAVSDGRLRVTAERGVITETIKQEISAHKTALLELLTEGLSEDQAGLIALPRDGELPLSLFQQRLWIAHRLDPESTDFNMATVWVLPGSLNAATVEAAIRAVVRDNIILRSTFRDGGHEPRVHLLPPDAVSIAVRDLRDFSEQEQEKVILAERSLATQAIFDLAVEAPVRWTVYQLASDLVATLVSAHHIALDDWSFSLLRQQLEAACTSPTGTPKATALQYPDYAAWQRRTADSAAAAEDLDWWERYLSGVPKLCTFPPDQTVATERSGSAHPFCLDAEAVAELRKLVRAEGATVYMALLAVCAVVLGAHAGQDDIVLGNPMGTRERPEFETMLGPFVNLLVLRLDLSNDPSFSELLARARDAVLNTYDHRNVPFEMVLQRLRPTRSLEHHPLFQVAVVMHNASNEPAAPIYSGGSIHDLTWYAREVEGRIEGSFEFRSDLYSADKIARIGGHLEISPARLCS